MKHLVSALFLLFLSVPVCLGQNGPIVPLDDPSLWALESLRLRGVAEPGDPGVQPWQESVLVRQLNDAVPSDEWARETLSRLRSRFSSQPAGFEAMGYRVLAGLRGATQDRHELIWRQVDAESSFQQRISAEFWFTAGSWTASFGFRHSRYYDLDPDGLDSAHRWMIRTENAYVARNGEFIDVLLGRVAVNQAGLGRTGLLISANPRPMDQISVRLGTDRLNLRTSILELDSITRDGRLTGIAGDDSVRTGSERRMLAVHRLAFRPAQGWTIGLSHSILYSGPGSGLSLKFANPLQLAILSIDDRPKNDENNGLLGAFIHRQTAKTLIQAQFLLDDFDILNGKEPASVAVDLMASRREIAPSLDIEVRGTMVTARTYNSEQAEGRYIYLGRGIGTQFSDFILAGVTLHWLSFPGWRISPGFDMLMQGELDIRSSFPRYDEADMILDGQVETTVRPFVRVDALMAAGLDLSADVGMAFISDEGHIAGASRTAFSGSLSLSYRIQGLRNR